MGTPQWEAWLKNEHAAADARRKTADASRDEAKGARESHAQIVRKRKARERTERSTPVARELAAIRIILAVMLILLGLWLGGVFNSGSQQRTVYVHFHGYVQGE
jgi:hypothetical protein